MDAIGGAGRNTLVRVALVAVLITTGIVVAQIVSQPADCCAGDGPYVALYDRQVSKVDMILAAGDGQAFGALAQDPLMQRPEVIAGGARTYSYRAQRPVWAVLAWIGSLGRPALVGWALVALTIVSSALAAAAMAFLLHERGASPWWALTVLVFGTEPILELTPELLAFALAACGIVVWQRRRPVSAVILLSAAALTRESMLVLVAALALWTLANREPRWSLRRVTPLAIPFVAYGLWSLVLLARLGALPNDSGQRLGLPGVGLVDALGRGGDTSTLVLWIVVGAALTVAAVKVAPSDVLTWIAVAFAGFATVFGPNVWLANFGYLRTLLPLFACGLVAVVPALEHARRGVTRPSVDAQ